MEVTKKQVNPSVAELFATMEYGPAPESDKIAQQWLDDHGRSFGHFISESPISQCLSVILSNCVCNMMKTLLESEQ